MSKQPWGRMETQATQATSDAVMAMKVATPARIPTMTAQTASIRCAVAHADIHAAAGGYYAR